MRFTARSTIIGALAVALSAAALAPGTSAGSRLTLQGVHPNPDEQSTLAGPVAPPILRVARASELAAIDRVEAQREAALSYRPAAGTRYSSAVLDAYAMLTRPPVSASAPTVKAPGDGFDFGAAAVGAGLAVTIMVLIAAGGLVARRRRQPQYG